MSKEVFVVSILVDRINNKLVATPVVIQTICVGEYEQTYVVQESLTNTHLRQVPKRWMFDDEFSAKQYIVDNKTALDEQCIDVVEAMKDWK